MNGLPGDIDEIIETYTYDMLSDKDLEKEVLLLSDGIYHWYMSNDNEFHHFVTEIQNTSLVLLQTYGGIDALVVKKFKKNM